MGITAKELAERIGVSASTVSMVLNHKKGISEETRQLVLDAAREYGLNSERLDRAVSEYKKILQYVIFKRHEVSVENPDFFVPILQGADLRSKELGYALQITYFYSDHDWEEQLNALRSSLPAGIILLAGDIRKSEVERFRSLNIPLVVLDSYIDSHDSNCITISNFHGGYKAGRYLIEKGFKHLGLIGSENCLLNLTERHHGFQMAVEWEESKDVKLTAVKFVWDEDKGYRQMKNYLETAKELPEVFFVDNDLTAIACMRAIKEAGLRIPEDVSIMGFDDLPADELLDTPLTSMHVSTTVMGSEAVSLLDQQICEPDKAFCQIEIPVTVVERASVRR